MNLEKVMTLLGWVASASAIIMYIAYIPQIVNNLHGIKGNPIQPLATTVNCLLWVIYALFKEDRDVPIAACNSVGIVFGLVAFFTAI